jgi:hypothetical protein
VGDGLKTLNKMVLIIENMHYKHQKLLVKETGFDGK